MRINTRVTTPMPVNAPVGNVREQTSKGTISRVQGHVSWVLMDNGVTLPWNTDTLREAI